MVVVLLLGVELDELMPPLEPVEPDELGELELLPLEEPVEPDELGELELLPPAEPPAPIEPVLLPPELPDAPELALPDEPPASEPPPLPQAVRDSAAAAMMASAAPRVNLEAFMLNSLVGSVSGGTRKRQPALPEVTLGVTQAPTVVSHCRTL
ncbi:MAG: hypothetical protein ACJ8GO_12880 [Ramlibacter sp.]